MLFLHLCAYLGVFLDVFGARVPQDEFACAYVCAISRVNVNVLKARFFTKCTHMQALRRAVGLCKTYVGGGRHLEVFPGCEPLSQQQQCPTGSVAPQSMR